MSQRAVPPDMEQLRRSRPSLGDRRFSLGLGDVRLILSGLSAALDARLTERFGPWSGAAGSSLPALEVEVRRARRDYFIEPPDHPEFNPVGLACDGPRIRYVGYRVAGWFDIGPGRGVLLLSSGEHEPADRAIENYIRAAVAWYAAEIGGALVHAASAVWRGRGYLFYGESGAGKSTLSEFNRRAAVVSDDLSLVLRGEDSTPELIGSPFRGTYEKGDPVLGRFPLVAGFRIVKAAEAEVRPVARPRAMSELVGNLPFVAEALVARPDLFDRLQGVFDGLPLAHLHFRKDESYWDAIAKAGLAG